MMDFLGEEMTQEDVAASAKEYKLRKIARAKASLSFSSTSNISSVTNFSAKVDHARVTSNFTEKENLLPDIDSSNSKLKINTNASSSKIHSSRDEKVNAMSLVSSSKDIVWADLNNIYKSNKIKIFWPALHIDKRDLEKLEAKSLNKLLKSGKDIFYLPGSYVTDDLRGFHILNAESVFAFDNHECRDTNGRNIYSAKKTPNKIWNKPLQDRYSQTIFKLP